MNKIKLLVLAFALIIFSACGGDSSSKNVETSLEDKLNAKEFFVIEDSIQTKNMYKISFDENLSSWEIKIYEDDYFLEPVNTVKNNILVSANSVINDGGFEYEFLGENSDYINLVATTNSLIALKLFTSSELAQEYYNLDLRDELKAKEFFVVQNDLEKRSLFKITVDENTTQWDIVSYGANYSDESITATSAGMQIAVTDSNLTDSGGASFWFSSKEDDYFRLVSHANNLITLKFFEASELAQAYYDSIDLRAEFKNKTFYAVSDNSTTKQLYKFVFNEELSQWEFNIYTSNYNETATNSGTSEIQITENLIAENGNYTLKAVTKNSDYIELKSLSSSLLTFRFYNSSELAQSYFDN